MSHIIVNGKEVPLLQAKGKTTIKNKESGVVYNPLSSKMHSDPYPIYRKLREKSPIHWSRLING